ncbi:hypothetical protein CK203_068732 [Vitis vinifera]|uniref:Uncharacterized protein n=1 Tax=Vitis vinifera TaxID=29760 RepID=A0A438EXP2_VITVI|nr:hypothetical protein CK203_068732 [Vitis vinifera]
MREGKSRNAPCRAEGVRFRKSNEAQIVELECSGMWKMGLSRCSREFMERSRQRRLTAAIRRFAQIIDELGLVDLPLQGGLFTWNGGQNDQSWLDWTDFS